jgi:serine/threonine protein kinase
VGHSYPTDIWSLGCCAIEMLTGRPPWVERTKSRSKVISLIRDSNEYPSAPDRISEECFDFIFHCCVVRDPSQRLTASELLEHPFIQTVSDEEDILKLLEVNRQSVLVSKKLEEPMERNPFDLNKPHGGVRLPPLQAEVAKDKEKEESSLNWSSESEESEDD